MTRSGFLREGEGIYIQRRWGKTDMLKCIKRPSSLMPGKFSYSNTNFTMLGLTIENIMQQTLKIEIRRRILDSPGLKDAYLEKFEESAEL
jgi:D-alanyl-D-alanine carboxypeptidase